VLIHRHAPQRGVDELDGAVRRIENETHGGVLDERTEHIALALEARHPLVGVGARPIPDLERSSPKPRSREPDRERRASERQADGPAPCEGRASDTSKHRKARVGLCAGHVNCCMTFAAAVPRRLESIDMADVLVVDDDQFIAQTVADILLGEGHTVRIGENGADGLRLLAERLPDLVFLDVEMPMLTGPEMAHRMLIEDAGRELIPIVLLSGVANLRPVAELVGTPYVLGKPCDLDDLLETAARALTERIAPAPKLRAPLRQGTAKA
jgi:CheY-like chemotaxis protein